MPGYRPGDPRIKREPFDRPRDVNTNSQINRERAMKMLKAGVTVQQIAKEFSKVFYVHEEDGRPKLGQLVTRVYADGTTETDYTILMKPVKALIQRTKRQNVGN